jgi:Cdc6-like AAA superfamily ATPase
MDSHASAGIPTDQQSVEGDVGVDGSFESGLRRAFENLQLSAVPPSLPCREEQRAEVYRFLRSAISSGGMRSALYISGLPGTGKTATVLEVVRALQGEQRGSHGARSGRGRSGRSDLPDFDFLEINAMKLVRLASLPATRSLV